MDCALPGSYKKLWGGSSLVFLFWGLAQSVAEDAEPPGTMWGCTCVKLGKL